jgi:glycerophosphoryl diester phosphodiesterase
VKAAHSAGVKMNAWTVNEPREIALFGEWGIDGIMSDFPERVPKS